MIDSSEPKDGDFVAYVERLVRLPEGARLPEQDAAPGQVSGARREGEGLVRVVRDALAQPRRGSTPVDAPPAAEVARTAQSDAHWGRTGASPFDADTSLFGSPTRDTPAAAGRAGRRGTGTDVEKAARDAVRALARILGRVATVMLIAGIGLLAIAFADHPPFRVDPMAGAVLAVAGGLIKRLAAKAA